MQGTRVIQHTALALLLTASLRAQNGPGPVTIANKLDTPQARVYVATLLPHMRWRNCTRSGSPKRVSGSRAC